MFYCTVSVNLALFVCILQAQCCSDHEHCCPNGMTCNVKEQRCDSNTNSISLSWTQLEKKQKSIEAGLITCPDKKAQCYDTQTCCLATDGSYECCPMPNVSSNCKYLAKLKNQHPTILFSLPAHPSVQI